MIAWINLTNHISCKCKCRFDGKNIIQINGGKTTNVDLRVKKVNVWEKGYIWNLPRWRNVVGKWIRDYVWWSPRIIRQRNKNYSNKL